MPARKSPTLRLLPGEYGVYRYERPIDPQGLPQPFFYADTGEEISLVCAMGSQPPAQTAQEGFCMLRVEGVLDFALVGILAGLTAPLRDAGISVFACSTFDTDYLLVRKIHLFDACRAWNAASIEVL